MTSPVQPTLFDRPPRRPMHAASVEKSPRLQRVLALLRRGGKFTTRQIIAEADVCAVNSCVAELRENGFDVRCAKQARGRFVYWLEPNGGT